MRLAMKKRRRTGMAYTTARAAKALWNRKPATQEPSWMRPRGQTPKAAERKL